MSNFGLIVQDEGSFFSRVINLGSDQGLFTRDKADELIKVAVAMANKYVLQKEVDFRSEEELAKVQETIIKLIGIGLEIRSKGEAETGVGVLMATSPVELFRVAYTRLEKLRIRWGKLLSDHKITIMVTKDEFECLSDLTCQKLSEMSIFTESELYTIQSLTLSDELFSALTVVEYYEKEAERYEFILKLKHILPFDLINRSMNVKAENLSEVDSIREALISTLIISARMETEDPVAVSMPQIREFLGTLGNMPDEDPFSEELENAVLEVIHELGEDLEESNASLLAKEVIRIAQKLMSIIVTEWDVISSPSDTTFYKRWSRLAILSDAPDALERIFSATQKLDDFDFHLLCSRISASSEDEVKALIKKIPWKQLTADQTVGLFHEIDVYQEQLAEYIELTDLTTAQLIDLIEETEPAALKKLLPKLKKAFASADVKMEDLELLAGMPFTDVWSLVRHAGPPSDADLKRSIAEFKNGSELHRKAMFHGSVNADFFPALFRELWMSDQLFVKKRVKEISTADIPSVVLHMLNENERSETIQQGEDDLSFTVKEVNTFFKSLPDNKRKAVVKHFVKLRG